MKKGDMVTTNCYGQSYQKMIGVIVNCSRDCYPQSFVTEHITYDIMWANGKFENYVSAKYLKVINNETI